MAPPPEAAFMKPYGQENAAWGAMRVAEGLSTSYSAYETSFMAQ